MKRFVVNLVGLAALSIGVGGARADNVLLFSTGSSGEDNAVVNLLQADGHTVTIGPQYENYTGTSLAGYTAVVLLQNDSGLGGDIPVAGQTELVNFVQAGGGLLTGEWTVWGIGNQHYNQTLAAVIPVVPTSVYNAHSSITYTQSAPDVILNAGLPSSYTFVADNVVGTESYFQPQPGATVFYGSDFGGSPPGDGVIGWGSGLGHVISFSTLAGTSELGDANYGQLFSNAVTWSETQQSPTVPEPSSLLLLGLGASGLVVRAARRRIRSASHRPLS